MSKSFELRRETSASLALVLVLVLGVIPLEADAFPSLFNVRSHSIFRRQQQPSQQQQQQPQAASVNQPRDSLIALGNEPSFGQHQFGAGRSLPVELMRINSAQQPNAAPVVNSIGAHQLHQVLLNSAASQPHQQRHFAFADSIEHDDQFNAAGPLQTGFYMPQAGAALAAARQPAISSNGASLQRQHSNSVEQSAAAFELGDSAGDYFSSIPQNEAKSSNGATNQPMRLEPSHTSEIVDKIEQHIGQQVQHSLQQHAAASGYQQHAEKEAAPSEGQEEAAGGGGESAGAMEEEPEKIEKRHEAEESSHKEPAEHSHHHMEHPPEAFEVHHKKGGKSFQYFHMGHQH